MHGRKLNFGAISEPSSKAALAHGLGSVRLGDVLTNVLQQELGVHPFTKSYLPLLQKSQLIQVETMGCTDRGVGVKHETVWEHLSLPMKLFITLSEPELFLFSVAWAQHGRAWKITNLDAFCKDALHIFVDKASSQHFRTFIRILALWGFRQFTKGPDTGVFFRELFLQGYPILLKTIRPTVERRYTLHDPNNEPNLYAIPPLLITQSHEP